MFELFVLETQGIFVFFSSYSEYFFLGQVANIAAIMTVFEYHWAKTLDDEFAMKYAFDVNEFDKKTYDAFKYLYALVPFISLYLYGRMCYQRFSSVKFLRDYATKRKL